MENVGPASSNFLGMFACAGIPPCSLKRMGTHICSDVEVHICEYSVSTFVFTHITHAKVCMSVLYDHIHFARVMTAPVVVTCL